MQALLRSLLVALVASCAAAGASDARDSGAGSGEHAMNDTLSLHEFGDASLPDRYFAPGRPGVRAGLRAANAVSDLGITAVPPSAHWLLVVIFSVPQMQKPPSWRLDVEHVTDEGEQRVITLRLVEPPLPGSATHKVEGSAVPSPGQVYDGAFWTDVTDVLGWVAPGSPMKIHYGEWSATVTVPGKAPGS